MTWRTIRAKYPGTCPACDGSIVPGDRIRWRRGARPQHLDCRLAKLRDTLCTDCNGAGVRWNRAPCRSCDGTGSRTVQDFAKAGGHPRTDKPISPYVEPEGGAA